MFKDIQIGEIVARYPEYKLRSCSRNDGHECLLQIANDASNNAHLVYNAWIINKFHGFAKECDPDSTKYGYVYGIPEIIDSSILGPDQGNRAANILGFRNVEKISSVIPIIKACQDYRIDLQSSAWIMGKLLKLIAFANTHNYNIGNISGNNILIEPNEHYVIIFDWSGVVLHEDGVPVSIIRDEIKAAAKVVLRLLDDPAKSRTNDCDDVYINHLIHLATDGEEVAISAHKNFYEIVDSLCADPNSVWNFGFHKFSFYRR